MTTKIMVRIGQRVSDLVAYAIKLLRDYASEAGAQGVRLINLESAEASALMGAEGITFSDVMRGIHADFTG